MVKTVVFVSNYINHHQMPFSEAMVRRLGEGYAFIQTEPMEEERIRMGWGMEALPSYVHLWYEEPETCARLIADADAVIFGGCDEESYIQPRLRSGKPVFRYTERLYKEAQWKFISPRGLLKKYRDHVRYNRSRVYMLCAGGYVASDFHLIHAYPRKMFQWGYFPAVKEHDIDALMESKAQNKEPVILWAGRMIDWKHPELALETAAYLRDKGLPFRMRIIGGGDMEEEVQEMCRTRGLTDLVDFLGFLKPEQVRREMENADIYLFTSDRKEGWGAVLNEAMNSGCAVVANHMIGAVPMMTEHGKNGFIYRDGCPEMLFETVGKLAGDRGLCREIGRRAYETVASLWNPENAAARVLELMEKEAENGYLIPEQGTGPCFEAPVLKERKAFQELTEK